MPRWLPKWILLGPLLAPKSVTKIRSGPRLRGRESVSARFYQSPALKPNSFFSFVCSVAQFAVLPPNPPRTKLGRDVVPKFPKSPPQFLIIFRNGEKLKFWRQYRAKRLIFNEKWPPKALSRSQCGTTFEPIWSSFWRLFRILTRVLWHFLNFRFCLAICFGILTRIL